MKIRAVKYKYFVTGFFVLAFCMFVFPRIAFGLEQKDIGCTPTESQTAARVTWCMEFMFSWSCGQQYF